MSIVVDSISEASTNQPVVSVNTQLSGLLPSSEFYFLWLNHMAVTRLEPSNSRWLPTRTFVANLTSLRGERPTLIVHAPVFIPPPPGEESLPKSMSPAERLVDAHEVSGLTWEQIAKYFGVSRRAVHLWAAGGRMSSGNEELLARLVQAVDTVRHLGASSRRQALLDSSSGLNIIDEQRASRSSLDSDINRSPEIGTAR